MPRDPWKLKVFCRAHQLVKDVYLLSSTFPPEERFGVAGQLRRAAVSIPLNIVEGCYRRSAREYGRFLDIATGSAAEIAYTIGLATELGLVSPGASERCRKDAEHVARELQNLQRAVERFVD